MLFVAMEEEVREHFRFGALEDSKERCRERLTTALSSNDEVLFHWCMLTAEIEEIHAQTVLDMLVSLWVTIRQADNTTIKHHNLVGFSICGVEE